MDNGIDTQKNTITEWASVLYGTVCLPQKDTLTMVVIMKTLRHLVFPLVCLVLFFGYRSYHDLQKSSLLQQIYNLNFSAGDLSPAVKDEDSSFATLFRLDDHLISVPKIPIDCSRILLVPTELSAVSQNSVET